MSTKCLLFSRDIPISNGGMVHIPTVGEILDNEEGYYSQISLLTAMPIDMCVALDDLGIDFTTINDYELFLRFFPVIQAQDTKLLFSNMDVSKFILVKDEESGSFAYINPEDGMVIDRRIYAEIADILRKLHGLKKDRRTPANETAKKYMIEKERKRLKRMKREPSASHLESLIIALVNTEQFPYRFDEVPDLTIYQFNESVKQIIHKIDFDNKMRGIYAGTISAKDMSQDELNWLEHK